MHKQSGLPTSKPTAPTSGGSSGITAVAVSSGGASTSTEANSRAAARSLAAGGASRQHADGSQQAPDKSFVLVRKGPGPTGPVATTSSLAPVTRGSSQTERRSASDPDASQPFKGTTTAGKGTGEAPGPAGVSGGSRGDKSSAKVAPMPLDHGDAPKALGGLDRSKRDVSVPVTVAASESGEDGRKDEPDLELGNLGGAGGGLGSSTPFSQTFGGSLNNVDRYSASPKNDSTDPPDDNEGTVTRMGGQGVAPGTGSALIKGRRKSRGGSLLTTDEVAQLAETSKSSGEEPGSGDEQEPLGRAHSGGKDDLSPRHGRTMSEGSDSESGSGRHSGRSSKNSKRSSDSAGIPKRQPSEKDAVGLEAADYEQVWIRFWQSGSRALQRQRAAAVEAAKAKRDGRAAGMIRAADDADVLEGQRLGVCDASGDGEDEDDDDNVEKGGDPAHPMVRMFPVVTDDGFPKGAAARAHFVQTPRLAILGRAHSDGSDSKAVVGGIPLNPAMAISRELSRMSNPAFDPDLVNRLTDK